MPHTTVRATSHTHSANPDPTAAAIVVQPATFVVRGRPGPLDRPALPSGHPESWGAITQGTVLDQSVYPFPIFLDRVQ